MAAPSSPRRFRPAAKASAWSRTVRISCMERKPSKSRATLMPWAPGPGQRPRKIGQIGRFLGLVTKRLIFQGALQIPLQPDRNRFRARVLDHLGAHRMAGAGGVKQPRPWWMRLERWVSACGPVGSTVALALIAV